MNNCLNKMKNFKFLYAAGIVPCGGTGQGSCTICDLFVGVKNIIDFLVEIAWLIGVVMLIYAGITLLTSGESESRREKGKKALWLALWGMIIAFAGWIIVDTVIKWLVASPGEFGAFGPWYAIPSCQ